VAGIGFSLRASGLAGGYLARARSLGAAGVVGAGPWLVASVGLLIVSRSTDSRGADSAVVERFQVSVTWILAASLVWTSPLQLVLTRFIADREYLRERERILPNVLGAMAFVSGASALLAACLLAAFYDQTLLVRASLAAAFVSACDAWLIIVVLGSLRRHRAVLGCFAAGYAVTVAACSLASHRGLAELLTAFVLGQSTLVFAGLSVILRCLSRDPQCDPVAFGFLEPRAMYLELGVTGLAFNLGCWADELVFWLDPATSRTVLGPLRASSIYDLPSFAAAACLVPGTAVFLVHVETELSERQRAFSDAVLAGATLQQLETLAQLWTDAARSGIAVLLRTLAATWLVSLALAPVYLRWLDLDRTSADLHVPLFSVTAFALSLQMLLSAVLSLLFYLDRRRIALAVGLLLGTSNAGLSWLTQRFSPEYYGYGHAIAMALTSVVALSLLNRAFANLVRDTFMSQPGAVR
jgi:uncharacterized membrane protein